MEKEKQIYSARVIRTAMMDEEILNVAGAAQVLGVSKKTIYGLLKKGELPYRKAGREYRFTRKSLRGWAAGDDRQTQSKKKDADFADLLKNSPNVRLVK